MSDATKKQDIPNIGFIESMECLAVPQIPVGPEWTYEIKLRRFPA